MVPGMSNQITPITILTLAIDKLGKRYGDFP